MSIAGVKREVGIAGREAAAFAGAGRVEDRDVARRARMAVGLLQMEMRAVPVERLFARPQGLHHVEPFLRIAVTLRMFDRQVEAERFVFRLVPAGDDIEADAATADRMDGGELLGDDHRMVRRRMDRRENGEVARFRQQAGRPGDGFEHAALEIRLAAIADPARDRQHEIEAGLVEQLRELQVVVPTRSPALRIVVTDMPPEQFEAKVPKRKRFLSKMRVAMTPPSSDAC